MKICTDICNTLIEVIKIDQTKFLLDLKKIASIKDMDFGVRCTSVDGEEIDLCQKINEIKFLIPKDIASNICVR